MHIHIYSLKKNRYCYFAVGLVVFVFLIVLRYIYHIYLLCLARLETAGEYLKQQTRVHK